MLVTFLGIFKKVAIASEMNGRKKTADHIASVPAEFTLTPLELQCEQYLNFGKKLSSKKRLPTLS